MTRFGLIFIVFLVFVYRSQTVQVAEVLQKGHKVKEYTLSGAYRYVFVRPKVRTLAASAADVVGLSCAMLGYRVAPKNV